MIIFIGYSKLGFLALSAKLLIENPHAFGNARERVKKKVTLCYDP